MNQPIEIFESQEQLNESLKEWQKRLFLNDWIIKAKLVDLIDNNDIYAGENERLPVEKYALINIKKSSDKVILGGEIIGKKPQEQSLIHELLHCKIDFILSSEKSTLEADWLYYSQHTLIDDMAKSLLMAKYNLKFDWFYAEGKV